MVGIIFGVLELTFTSLMVGLLGGTGTMVCIYPLAGKRIGDNYKTGASQQIELGFNWNKGKS